MSSAKTFFSYSRNDQAFVLRLAQDLRQAGIPIWFDQLDIPPGQRWDNEIQKALSTASSLLVVLSPASTASENVMDEVSYALDQNKHVIPVLYQPSDVPLRIRRLQYIDFTTNYEAGLTNLLRVLRQTNSDGAGSNERATQPVANTAISSGFNTDRSAAKPAGSMRKPLLYGAGALMLALLLYFVFQLNSSPENEEANVKGTSSDTTTDIDAGEDSVPSVAYTFDYTSNVDKLVADSVLDKMNNYVDPETKTALPASLSYELTHEGDCYEFYIKMGKGTVLPEGWMDMIKSFGAQLDQEMFGDECLKVGAWDYMKKEWVESVIIGKDRTS